MHSSCVVCVLRCNRFYRQAEAELANEITEKSPLAAGPEARPEAYMAANQPALGGVLD